MAGAAAGEPSALIVEVPEAEPVVGRWRQRLDANARAGVPAHVTVLFPFLPPEAVDGEVRERLAELFGAVPSFGFSLDRVDWFGEETVWLAPRDPAPFSALTERVFAEFPACPPFGGQFEEVLPHLTVGHQLPVAELWAAGEAIRANLPVEGVARAVSLWAQDDGGRWRRTAAFTLA